MMNAKPSSPTIGKAPVIPGLEGSPSTPLLGRDEDVRTLLQLLDSDGYRVVTLLGPGGVGKTRLAEEVTRAIAPAFAHGARFVRVESVRDPHTLARTVADRLGLQQRANQSPDAVVERFLADRHMLLVLDNLEQIVGAASTWVSHLLSVAPRLRIMATSRIPLRIMSERQYVVPPLETMGDDPSRDPAVMLFVERAAAVRHDLVLDEATMHVVAEICRQLDGLPLAIELAAARTKVLSPDTLLARLTDRLTLLTGGKRDVPLRMQSMRDAIGWSYDLLSPDEQRLFCRLALFPSGFALETADFVAAWPQPSGSLPSTLDLLQSLVEQNLIQIVPDASATSFRMLETIREFGLSQLGDEDDAYRVHAEYFLEVARRADPALAGPDQAAWLRRLDAAYPDILSAVSWLNTHDRLEDAIELMVHLRFFLVFRGHSGDALPRLTSWLERLDADAPSRSRGLLLMVLGRMHQDTGKRELAKSMLVEAVAIFQEEDDLVHAATAQGILAITLLMLDSLEEARAAGEAALAMARPLGLHRITCAVLGVLAQLASSDGDRDRVRQLREASIRTASEGGDRWSMAFSRYYVGEDAIREGRLEDARHHIEEFRQLMDEIGALYDLGVAWSILAWIDRTLGDLETASGEIANALAIASSGGYQELIPGLSQQAAIIASERGDRDAAAGFLTTATGTLRTPPDPSDLAGMLETCAIVASKTGDSAAAARFLGASRALAPAPLRRSEDPFAISDAQNCQRSVAAALGRSAYRRELQTGSAWTIEDAIAAMSSWTPASPDREHTAPGMSHPLAALSPREREILRHIANGMTNQEIADMLFLSRRTVTTHVTSILAKLGVDSRTAAVAWAIRTGLA